MNSQPLISHKFNAREDPVRWVLEKVQQADAAERSLNASHNITGSKAISLLNVLFTTFYRFQLCDQ
jgi:hypothetical protein